jgi:mRNA interferase RelE/StbE
MAWRIEFDQRAAGELGRLDPQISRRILRFLKDRVQGADDPRAVGEPLKGATLGDYLKYRRRNSYL